MFTIPQATTNAINVTVDGDVIAFTGQAPVEQSGMVLVPLRGVFEKLGATVFYDAASQTIRAVRGATEISLRVGSTDASVNGRPQTLALPATTRQGATLVPLRFVSEALGARVSWRGASRTVVIQTDAAPTGPVPETIAAPEVRSLTFDAPRPLRGGEKLTVTLLGTPGAEGTFSVSGVESARSVSLKETDAGTYVGSFIVPVGAQVKNAPMLASLRKSGKLSPMIQSSQAVTLDGTGPQIGTLSPAPNAAASTQNLLIYATLSDSGTGIDPGSVRVTVNGADVTAKATVTEAFFSYKPEAPLPAGKTAIAVTARDLAGNESSREWSFQVAANAAPAPTPRSVDLKKPTIVTPASGASAGGSVEITGKASAGATVRYRLTFQGNFLILPTEGVVSEGEVKADASGVWKVAAIALKTPLGVSKLVYTLEATTVGAGDAVSEAATVTFKK
ncbi:MAG: stalk domain-containing protein [Armatimonas sp.]